MHAEQTRVTLTALTDDEYAEFAQQQMIECARQSVNAGEWREEEAIARAREEYATGLLADSLRGAGHLFLKGMDARGAVVGWLWVSPAPEFLETPRENKRWLSQITVEPQQRGRGWGKKMLETLHAMLAAERVEEVWLRVYDWNEPARRLYQSMGYEVARKFSNDAHMRRRLDANRAMILTPAGSGAIAVVRINGPKVREFLAERLSRPVTSGRCVHADLRDGDAIIDDAVVVLSEDGLTADLNVHGGPWIVERVIELLKREGFGVEEAHKEVAPLWGVEGETILEKEMVAYLPRTRTELGVRVLLAQERAWRGFQERVKRREIQSSDLRFQMERMLTDEGLKHLLHPPDVAIVGLANVGKSTLANRLFAQERSITADVPGTTRDWVGEYANVDGLVIHLVDTPGVRVSGDAIEQSAIAAARPVIEAAQLVVLVLDVTIPLSEQRDLIEKYPEALRVANKVDREGMWRAEDVGALAVCAARGEGVEELRKQIRGRFGCEAIGGNAPMVWTDRQRQILARALSDSTALREI